MELQEYKKMYELESHYWWFVARREIIERIIAAEATRNRESSRPRIFDVGCGTGANLALMSKYGETFGIDMSKEALLFCRERGLNDLAISRIERLGYLSDSFNIISTLDVLEHIDEDLLAMEELYRICKPGGMLLVTVPAFGFLWSEHDEAVHHRRRYTSYELRNKLSLVGFEIERCSYFFTFLFFPLFVIRVVQGIFKKSTHPQTSHEDLPPLINQMLIWLMAVECFLLRYINMPVGVSIFCVARKPLVAKKVEEKTDVNVIPFDKVSRSA